MSGFISSGISIHALPAEGDWSGKVYSAKTQISIHALPAEGDCVAGYSAAVPIKFQSTPSPRRATNRLVGRDMTAIISIHALPAEGDLVTPSMKP